MSKTGLSVASMSASEKAKLNAMLDAAQASAGGKALSKEVRQRVTEEAKAQILAARERTLLEQQRKEYIGGFVQLVSIGSHAATAVSGARCPTLIW